MNHHVPSRKRTPAPPLPVLAAALLALAACGGCTSTDTAGHLYPRVYLPLPGAGEYSVTTTPAGADIYFNGVLKGASNLHWTERDIQSLGTDVIEAKLPGGGEGMVKCSRWSRTPRMTANARVVHWSAPEFSVHFDLTLRRAPAPGPAAGAGAEASTLRPAPRSRVFVFDELSRPAVEADGVRTGSALLPGRYQPVAVVYSATPHDAVRAPDQAELTARAGAAGAEALIGCNLGFARWPFAIAARRTGDATGISLAAGRPCVVRIDTVNWRHSWGLSRDRSMNPHGDIGLARYRRLAQTLAEKGYFAYPTAGEATKDAERQGAIPNLAPDFALQVEVIDQKNLFILIGNSDTFTVRVDLVNLRTGAVEQTAVGRGSDSQPASYFPRDTASQAMTDAIVGAILQWPDNRPAAAGTL